MAKKDIAPAGARYLMIGASVIVVLAGLKAASVIIVPLLLAIFVSLLSFPLLFWLLSKRVPTLISVAATILADLAILAGAVFVVTGSINEMVQKKDRYQDRFLEYKEDFEEFSARTEARFEGWGVELPSWFPRFEEDPDASGPGVGEVQRGDDLVSGEADDAWWLNLFDLQAVFDVANRTFRGVAAALSNTLYVVLITTFILLEAVTFRKKLRLAFGRGAAEQRFERVLGDLRRYLSLKTLISAATGVLIGGWLAILGVDFALLWGLVAFLFNFIPNIGSILAAIPTMLLAVVQQGFAAALLVGLGYLLVNMVLGNFLEPQLMGRRLGLSTLVVFLSLVFWGFLWGPAGMLLSVPLTIIVKILLENTEDFRWVAVLIGNVSSESKAARFRTRPPAGKAAHGTVAEAKGSREAQPSASS